MLRSTTAIPKLAALALLACGLTALAGCSAGSSAYLDLTGSFVDDAVVLSMPALPRPTLEPAIGATPSRDATGGVQADEPHTALVGDDAAPANTAPTDGPAAAPPPGDAGDAGWYRIAEVLVAPGDEVSAGQVLVRIDYPEGAAALAAAQADLARSRADLELIEQMSGDITQGRSDIASQTVELQNTISDLQTQRTELQVQLDAARALLEPPSDDTTPTPVPPSVIAQIAQLEGAIADIDTGIRQAEDGLEDLEEARTELEETQGVLGSVRSTASTVVDARVAVVNLMRARTEQAVITSPARGIVTSAVRAGEVRAGGAPLVTLRTLDRPQVRTWVTAEEVRRIRDGSSARVSLDSMPGAEYTGLVIGIGDDYRYVPTSFATRIMHLTRGFEVTIEVYGAPDLPPGTPADVAIQTN